MLYFVFTVIYRYQSISAPVVPIIFNRYIVYNDCMCVLYAYIRFLIALICLERLLHNPFACFIPILRA